MKIIKFFIPLLLLSSTIEATTLTDLRFNFHGSCYSFDCPNYRTTTDSVLNLTIDTDVGDINLTDTDGEFKGAIKAGSFYDALTGESFHSDGASFTIHSWGLPTALRLQEEAHPYSTPYYQSYIYFVMTMYNDAGASYKLGANLEFYDLPSLGVSLKNFKRLGALGSVPTDSHVGVNNHFFFLPTTWVLSSVKVSAPEPWSSAYYF